MIIMGKAAWAIVGSVLVNLMLILLLLVSAFVLLVVIVISETLRLKDILVTLMKRLRGSP